MKIRLTLIVILAFIIISCSSGEAGKQEQSQTNATPKEEAMALTISSPNFENGGTIPKKYTCSGVDVNPELNWSGVPDGAKSLVLICDDPDAPGGNWNHWLVYDIPPNIDGIPEAADSVPGMQGMNSFDKKPYGGPCPPPGKPHRYFFKLFAIGEDVDYEPGMSREDLLALIDGKVLAQAEYMGKFGR